MNLRWRSHSVTCGATTLILPHRVAVVLNRLARHLRQRVVTLDETLRDRPRFARANHPPVNLRHRDQFGTRAGEKTFVGVEKIVARQVRLACGNAGFARQLGQTFQGEYKMKFHLAPPLLARRDDKGHLIKMSFGPWMMPAFRMLARMKHLRGGKLDVFGYTAERRMERKLIADYESMLDEIAAKLSNANHATCVELATIPERMKGFGHVKQANVEGAKKREAELLAAFRNPPGVRVAAE